MSYYPPPQGYPPAQGQGMQGTINSVMHKVGASSFPASQVDTIAPWAHLMCD